jgi:hypothetical protein
MKYGKRSKFKVVLSSPVTLVVLVLLFALLFKASWNIHSKNIASLNKKDQFTSELSRLEDRKNFLSREIGRLSTDQGVANEIRTKFKGAKEGESLAVIIDDTATSSPDRMSSTTATGSLSGEQVGWFARVFRAMGF